VPHCTFVVFLITGKGPHIQAMPVRSYDGEPAAIAGMDIFLQENGSEHNFSGNGLLRKNLPARSAKSPSGKAKNRDPTSG
jgi:hypothetical protein